jgi:hypothetical protein
MAGFGGFPDGEGGPSGIRTLPRSVTSPLSKRISSSPKPSASLATRAGPEEDPTSTTSREKKDSVTTALNVVPSIMVPSSARFTQGSGYPPPTRGRAKFWEQSFHALR